MARAVWAGHTFTVQPVGDGVHLVTDSVGLVRLGEGSRAPALVRRGDGSAASAGGVTPQHVGGSINAPPGTNGVYVDVVALSTPRARLHGNVRDILLHHFDVANSANYASGLPFRFRLLHVSDTNFVETASSDADLNELQVGRGHLAAIGPLRAQFSPDIVMLAGQFWAQNEVPPICGRAYQMDAGEVNANFEPFAVNLIDVSCNHVVGGHELGHNMSLRHEWGNPQGGDNANSPFTYNHAHYDLNLGNPLGRGFYTIMGGPPQACGVRCDPIHNWSDPALRWDGRPVGVAGGAQPANNQLALRNTNGVVAGFRVRPHPFGSYDREERVPGGVHVYGWALDYDFHDPLNGSLVIDAYLDGAATRTNWGLANQYRGDVAAVFPGFGPLHGYEVGVLASPGSHRVCTHALNVGPGGNQLLGCRNFFVTSQPFGSLDIVVRTPGGGDGTIRVGGWAIDPEVGSPIDVEYYIDGAYRGRFAAADDRPDVASRNYGYGPYHGFNRVFGGLGVGSHTVQVVFVNVGVGSNVASVTRSVNVAFEPDRFVRPSLQGWAAHACRGWAFDWDTAGPITVRVAVDGVPQPDQTAEQYRSDVDAVYEYEDYGGNHGFDFIVVAAPGQNVCVTAVNVGPGVETGLGCHRSA